MNKLGLINMGSTLSGLMGGGGETGGTYRGHVLVVFDSGRPKGQGRFIVPSFPHHLYT